MLGACRVGCVVGLRDEVRDRNTLAKSLVDVSLSLTEVHKHVDLNLVAKLLLDVLLDTTQHERLEDHVQTLELFGLERRVASARSVLNVL